MSRLSGRYGTGPAGLCRFLLFACMAAASGCTTMHALEQESAAARVEPGDTVYVSTRDGRELELAFDAWSSDGLTGTDDAGILQKIGNEDVERVEVKKISAWKNLALGAVIVGLSVAAVDDTVDAVEDLLEPDN